jgi:hypothetical protein
MHLRKFLKLFFVPGLIFLSACRPPINMDEVFPDPATVHQGTAPGGALGIAPGPGEKFLPEHRRILEMTGWYTYASSNIDAIEYFDREGFSVPEGLAIGLARYARGIRVAQIALKNRSDAEVCATIVHEATHLSGIAQIGEMYGEEEARAAELRFWQEWQSLRQR